MNGANGIFAILGIGGITALLILGSGHVALPFSAQLLLNEHFNDDDDGIPFMKQKALNICHSNLFHKNDIKIRVKGGSLWHLDCLISQQQTMFVDPPLIQKAINVCASDIGNKNKIRIDAKDGSLVEITCIIDQSQTVSAMGGFGDPLLSQKSFNICGSNIGDKNKIEIKAKDGSTVIITCVSTQTQSMIVPMMPPQPVDPIQDSVNICGSNIGDKNKIKIEAKDGSTIMIICDSSQLQSMSVDPLLSQQSTNLCGSNVGDKNKIDIKAKDGSTVIITCDSTQGQFVNLFPPPDP